MLLGSCSGTFYAFDRETGDISWSYDTALDGEPAEFHGDPLVSDGLVVTGCDRTTLNHTYALRLDSGSLEWKQERFAFESDLLRVGDRVIGRTWNGDLIAMSLATGAMDWTVQPDEYVYSYAIDDSPVEHEGMIYFGGVDGSVYAVDGASGSIEWKQEMGTRITVPPVTDGTDLYVGTADNNVHRLSITDGSILAVGSLDARPFGRATLTREQVLFLATDQSLVSLDRNLDTVLWSWTASPAWSSYQPLLRDSLIFVGSRDGRFIGLNIRTGEEAYSISVDGLPRGIGASGDTLYLGTLGGALHALLILRCD